MQSLIRADNLAMRLTLLLTDVPSRASVYLAALLARIQAAMTVTVTGRDASGVKVHFARGHGWVAIAHAADLCLTAGPS
jgi:hypothetical protein